MADISQVKLPNGDTYNLVDETSGFSKVHIVEANLSPIEGAPTVDASYAQLKTWIDANEIVVLKDSVGEERFYLKTVNTDSLWFMNLAGLLCEISANSVILRDEDYWITLRDLPIYDGTVE